MRKDIGSVKNALESYIPINRFYRGEASRIFEEVSRSGAKMVIKNNTPTCVLIDPDEYVSLLDALEDYALFFEAEKRMEMAKHDELLTEQQVLKELGIHESDLDDIEVEIE